MITYQLTNENYIYKIDDSTKTTIPLPVESPLFPPYYNEEYEKYKNWLNEGNIPLPPEISFEEQYKNFLEKIEDYYDKKAQEKNYNNRFTCALRASYAGPFQQEGIFFGSWMDNCNKICYDILKDVKAGNRDIPSFEEVISEFPSMSWE